MKTLFCFVLIALSVGNLPVDSTAPAEVAAKNCTMSDGKDRPYPCEFQLVAMYVLGKNNEVAGTLTPGNTTVKLPKSKAISNPQHTGGESFIYNVSLDFRRINKASFSPKPGIPVVSAKGFYQIGTARVDSPLTTGEVKTVRYVNVGPTVPAPEIRPNRVAFTLQLDYSTGSSATLLAPVKYIQIANPITFSKFPASVIQCRDRAEAFMVFNASVDMSK